MIQNEKRKIIGCTKAVYFHTTDDGGRQIIYLLHVQVIILQLHFEVSTLWPGQRYLQSLIVQYFGNSVNIADRHR